MSDRRWLTIVQIDVSWSTCIYGVSPCTAVLGTQAEVDAGTATGTQKCFNTIGTCQDRPNYQDGIATLSFCKDSGYQALSGIPDLIPSLVSVDMTPGVVSLGEDLGQRASAKITFRDHPHSDAGEGYDKYLADRDYNPYDQGWYWAKFAARQPNTRGKKLRIYQGWAGQTLDQMIVQNFVIDSVDGPGLDGRFVITVKDPLKSLDSERAQAPSISAGVLNTSIGTTDTTIGLSPLGSGDGYYGTSGWVNIGGSEICSYTRTTGSDVLTIVRAQKGTSATSHSAGDRVQACLSYVTQSAADILHDLIVTYGGVDPSLIDLADWQSEVATYNSQVYTGFLTDPVGVKTVIAEIIQQAGLVVWWDEFKQKIRLQVLRSIPTDAATFDETMVAKGTLKITSQPDKRKSEIWVYFGQRNPLDDVQLSNLPGIAVRVDTDSEDDYGGSLIKTIKSRWIPTGGLLIAQRISEIQLGRYLSPPRKVEFALPVDEDSSNVPVVGGGYKLSAPPVQAADGTRTTIPFSVTSIKIVDGLLTVTGEELNWTELSGDPFSRTISVDYNLYNQNMRTMHDNLYGTPTAGGVVTLHVSSNARIGSVSTGLYGLDVGSWPSTAFTATRSTSSMTLTGIADTTAFVADQFITGTGIAAHTRVVSKTSSTVTVDKLPTTSGTGSLTLWTTILEVSIDGRVVGAGGRGGDGHNGDNWTGNPGSPGGPAMLVRAPVELTGAGIISGGGGGGGAGGSDYQGWFGPQVYGGSGGGGAGDLPGSGGSPVISGAGASGTLDSGGAGGGSNFSNWRGGNGGDPGAGGGSAVGDFAGSGAGAGAAVDGYTFVRDSDFTGVYHGSKVN